MKPKHKNDVPVETARGSIVTPTFLARLMAMLKTSPLIERPRFSKHGSTGRKRSPDWREKRKARRLMAKASRRKNRG